MKKPPKTRAQQYLSYQWKRLRKRVLQRDGYKCKECGKKTKLQCHHNYYIEGRKVWDYPLSAFTTLCFYCHKAFHDVTKGAMMVRPETDKKKLRKKK